MSVARLSVGRPVGVAMLFLACAAGRHRLLPPSHRPAPRHQLSPARHLYVHPGPGPGGRAAGHRARRGAGRRPSPGVENVTSVSREGVSLVTLRFAWGTDMDFAHAERAREDGQPARRAPGDGGRARASCAWTRESEPIMVLSVAGPTDLWETKELAGDRVPPAARAARRRRAGRGHRRSRPRDPRRGEPRAARRLRAHDRRQVSQALDRANASAPRRHDPRGPLPLPAAHAGRVPHGGRDRATSWWREQASAAATGGGADASVR